MFNPTRRDTMPDRMQDLGDLRDACMGCRNCDLAIARTNVVFARGNPYAHAMIVGEAPGADEDATGKPFVGRAGQLLDRMFKSVGLDTEEHFYLTNTVRCRPPGNAKPTPDQTAACKYWLIDQIHLLQPRFIVAVGGVATSWFKGEEAKITHLRGRWFTWSPPDSSLVIPVFPILHPAYLLRQNDPRWEDPTSPHSLTFRDMKAIRRAYQNRGLINTADLPAEE
jgi:DNA polymerase